MTNNDLVQMGALAAIAYIAYQKFGKKDTTDVDFGVTNPNDASWGDNTNKSTGGVTFIQQIIADML